MYSFPEIFRDVRLGVFMPFKASTFLKEPFKVISSKVSGKTLPCGTKSHAEVVKRVNAVWVQSTSSARIKPLAFFTVIFSNAGQLLKFEGIICL